ncbi:MAG: hypothetical protein HC915_15265 [Anaerolineae bacterium]|nr:hypothetical protein [Anaerolineae bacterium]
MPSKLGFWLQAGSLAEDRVLAQLRAAPPRGLGVAGSSELLNRAYEAVGPDAITLFQGVNLGDATAFVTRYPSVEAAVNALVELLSPVVSAAPWAYHLVFESNTLTPQGIAFEALAIAQVRQRLNVRLCVGHFPSSIAASPADWAPYQPVLEAAARYGALVGLREVYPLLPYVAYGAGMNLPDPPRHHPPAA